MSAVSEAIARRIDQFVWDRCQGPGAKVIELRVLVVGGSVYKWRHPERRSWEPSGYDASQTEAVIDDEHAVLLLTTAP